MPTLSTTNPNIYADYGLYINGAWCEADQSATITVIDPATEQPLGTIPHATQKDIERAIQSSTQAFTTWRATMPWDRAAILRRASDLIRERTDAMARLLSQEQGKPLAEALREVGMAADHFEWASEEAKRIYGLAINARPAGSRSVAYREPIGVVAAFTPWNFPALQPSSKIPYALAAGCTVIVKPAEETPGICMAMVQALHDAGLPPGACNLVVGDPAEISSTLFNAPEIRAVSFTGSTAVGKQLMALGAPSLKRLTMELGGHAPLIVLADADPEEAATKAAMIKFRNAGQACVSPSRFYIHESLVERFTKKLIECAEALKLGGGLEPTTQMGPLANARRLRAAEELVEDAVRNGAKIECGGKRPDDFSQGFFYLPTVLSGVSEQCKIMNEEPFAPIAPITSFTNLDDVLNQANRLPYGLAAYVFTSSAKHAEYCSARLEAGMVGINNFNLATTETPFGGVKDSGFGREGGPHALDEYLLTKLVKSEF